MQKQFKQYRHRLPLNPHTHTDRLEFLQQIKSTTHLLVEKDETKERPGHAPLVFAFLVHESGEESDQKAAEDDVDFMSRFGVRRHQVHEIGVARWSLAGPGSQ